MKIVAVILNLLLVVACGWAMNKSGGLFPDSSQLLAVVLIYLCVVAVLSALAIFLPEQSGFRKFLLTLNVISSLAIAGVAVAAATSGKAEPGWVAAVAVGLLIPFVINIRVMLMRDQRMSGSSLDW